MPERRTIERARQDKAQGKAPSTQAGEFVREEMDHIREGKHGAKSSKQAIAIGLSKARRSGVELPPPKEGKVSSQTRRSAARDYARGHGAAARSKSTAKRSRASTRALEREGRSAASPSALAKQTRAAAAKRTKSERSASAKKAVRTKGPSARAAAAKRAARTRSERTGAHA